MPHRYERYYLGLIAALCVGVLIWVGNVVVRDAHIEIQPVVTFIGIAVALGIALWQQDVLAKREQIKYDRASLAARSVMPAALSEIITYIDNSVQILRTTYPTIGTSTSVQATVSMPQWPSSAIDILRDCIENAERDDAQPIIVLIQWLQIVNSRVSSLIDKGKVAPISAYEIEWRLYDLVTIHVQASDLYPYARQQKKRDKILLKDKLYNSAEILGLYKETFPELHRTIEDNG